jgi:hypothetical protein
LPPQVELRSMSLLFGETLEGFDLSNSNVNTDALAMVSIRYFHLRTVALASCQEVTDAACFCVDPCDILD